jgi:predicted nucleotidyltransferase component of viral defense system
MQDLIKQEKFELEVLDRLNSERFLDKLIFAGGTMLRLCYGLNRYSVDLDFWLRIRVDQDKLYSGLKACLAQDYSIKDSANKFYTLLFDLKSKDYPRSLKIEIRKEQKNISTEETIAYSRFSNTQVLLKTVSLTDMMQAKIDAFLSRKEIRDVFDIEFLLKKGIEMNVPRSKLRKILKEINKLNKNDYNVKLASLLDEGQRQYYKNENFKILKSVISEKLID